MTALAGIAYVVIALAVLAGQVALARRERPRWVGAYDDPFSVGAMTIFFAAIWPLVFVALAVERLGEAMKS